MFSLCFPLPGALTREFKRHDRADFVDEVVSM
jgi:hypothetical protein